MHIEGFIDDFADYISRQPCVRGFDEVHIIVNPVAGSFTRQKIFKSIVETFHQHRELHRDAQRIIPADCIYVHRTYAPGDCETIVKGQLSKTGEERKMLFISAGGDGTAAEAASEIYRFIEQGGNDGNHVLFRLPMGTGNDGLDADSMDTVFRICAAECQKVKIPILEITFPGGAVKYATNIASFGLDAYVTDKTNKLKRIIPGSFYSVMVDVAALFYEYSVEMKPIEIEYIDAAGEKKSKDIISLLLAMGVSGNRSYGGGKLVLPGKENVCAIGPMKLKRKFAVKNLLYQGKHTVLEEVTMFEAKEMTVNFPGSLLFQYDGEVIPLTEKDFPVHLTILPPAVQVLRPKDLTILPGLRGL